MAHRSLAILLTAIAAGMFTSFIPLEAAIPPAERDALISLYTDAGGAGWNDSSGWLGPPGTECTWIGVACDPDETHVVGLYLAWNNLSGSLPPAIGNLSELEDLSLCCNPGLGGPIPAEIGALAQLIFLDLRDDQMTGSIPPALGNLSNLQHLGLGSNRLTGSIPSELGGLIELRWLYLNGSGYPGTGLTGEIPGELGALTNLLDLHLHDNRLSGPIPPQLGNLTSLGQLSLGRNLLVGAIPAELGGLSALWGLYLEGNLLSGSIPPELGNLTNLGELVLLENHLSGPIPAEIGNLTALWWLDLSRNCLSGPIPPEIGNLVNLQGMHLTANMISGTVPATITNLVSLGDWSSSIGWNAVHSDDPAVIAFMDAKFGSGWRDSQTIPPQNLAVAFTTGISAGLAWDPIPYEWDAGGYDVMVSESIGGPYQPLTRTLGKQVWSWALFDLAPSTTYYVKLCAVTEPHPNNQNTVMSELTAPISVTTTADPSTWYAATTGVPGNDCATPSTPCPTVQDAIWSAGPGERVMVASGTYHERLTVDRIIEVVGEGAASTVIDAGGGGTAIWVAWGTHAHVSNLTLRSGTIHLGGGVYVAPNSMLELADSIVSDNQAHSSGGGIFVDFQSGARLDRVEITGNVAGDSGGGLYSSWGTHVVVSDSRITDNSAPWGGGLYLTSCACLTRSTVERNTAESYGGGGMASEGIAFVSDSTLANNQAMHGGGIANLSNGYLEITNSTISANSGGGLFNDRWARVELESCTVVDNVAPFTEHSGVMNWSDLHLHNTMIADNSPFDCANPVTSDGHNLDSDGTCTLDGPGDLSAVDPMLGPLADNGGPTMTHVPDPAGPAVDSADPSDFPPFDQRGWERPLDGNADGHWLPDIGAVEYAGVVFFDSFESGDTTAWSSTAP